MEKPTKRFMINTKTKAIWSYDHQAIRLNDDLVECNELGVPIGRAETVTDELYEKIIELEGEIAEKNLRISALESRLAEVESELKAATVNPRKEALGEMTAPELRKLAETLGVELPARANKAEIVDAVYAAELMADSEIESSDLTKTGE